jgi:pimeloyl-ACP methyl ester carboxylesterase
MNENRHKIQKIKSPAEAAASGFEMLLSGVFAVASGWIIYSALGIHHDLELPQAVAAERRVFYSPTAGKLSYYTDPHTTGRPLVLIHSVNAAASAFEMRPLFEHYRGTRPVYALDLPGYGFSERSSRVYHPELFQKAIQDFLELEVKEPADVVALSLSSEFCARAAQARPELFHSLTIISPTGLNFPGQGRSSQKAGMSGTSSILYPIFSFQVWSRAFFDLITTRISIQYFLAQSFVSPVPEALIAYAYATAHQPGAENVPLYFISGKLFTQDVRSRFYEKVTTPTLVIYDHDAFTQFDALPELIQKNKNWQAVRIIPTRGLPHWDQLPQTASTLDSFWQRLA